MRKIPTIILSITYKGVKFIDASNKVCPLPALTPASGAPSSESPPGPTSTSARCQSLVHPLTWVPGDSLSSSASPSGPTSTLARCRSLVHPLTWVPGDSLSSSAWAPLATSLLTGL